MDCNNNEINTTASISNTNVNIYRNEAALAETGLCARLRELESKCKSQEEDIVILKSALCDALKRIHTLEHTVSTIHVTESQHMHHQNLSTNSQSTNQKMRSKIKSLSIIGNSIKNIFIVFCNVSRY